MRKYQRGDYVTFNGQEYVVTGIDRIDDHGRCYYRLRRPSSDRYSVVARVDRISG